MAAFETLTELYSYFRQKAQEMNCNPCFDKKQKEIEIMNENGSNGHPACLCKKGSSCPCKTVEKELARDGICYCEIFVVVK
jgi:ferredoxin-thioredoxin reductase catalytic subunit